MNFSIRNLLLATVIVVMIIAGCKRESNIQQIRQGMESVDKHANDIEKAGDPIAAKQAVP